MQNALRSCWSNGWRAVVKKGQFAPGDIYIEPDYTVPTARPEFSFPSINARIGG